MTDLAPKSDVPTPAPAVQPQQQQEKQPEQQKEQQQQQASDETCQPPVGDLPAVTTANADEAEPLPAGWAHVMDNVTGRLFYNHDDGRRQLDHPVTAIPRGWGARKDPKSGLTFYQHAVTGASSWTVPVVPPPPGSEGRAAVPPPPPPLPAAAPEEVEPPAPKPVPTGDAGVAAVLLHANVYLKNEADGRYLQLKTSTGVTLCGKGPAKYVATRPPPHAPAWARNHRARARARPRAPVFALCQVARESAFLHRAVPDRRPPCGREPVQPPLAAPLAGDGAPPSTGGTRRSHPLLLPPPTTAAIR
jgi:hypothetical protein